jgi:hypothetical protein
MGIFPRNDNMAFIPVIDQINDKLSKFADGKKIRYLNINDKFAADDGTLFGGMMNAKDTLHPTLKAYQIWADALKPVLTELLGPPAAVDHAPAPTSDPAAGKVRDVGRLIIPDAPAPASLSPSIPRSRPAWRCRVPM